MPRPSRIAWGGSGLILGLLLGLLFALLVGFAVVALMAHSFPHLSGSGD